MPCYARLSSLAVLFCIATSAFAVGGGGLSYNGLAQTPQMGWDTYNAYALDYNESTIRTNAARLVSLGFRDLGYVTIIFDDAMTERNRSSNGSLVENASKFPSGLKNISDFLHADGLQYGVYSSAGKFTCGGYPGSLGYETIDAAWWASLGADVGSPPSSNANSSESRSTSSTTTATTRATAAHPSYRRTATQSCQTPSIVPGATSSTLSATGGQYSQTSVSV